MAGSLEGLKVLDLSRFIAGPMCGMLLGDMGADVVKVERAGKGEDGRVIAPKVGGESLYVMMYNRNKRSLTLDYRSPEGQELLRNLAAEADVLIENFRPGTLEKMGCGWEELSARNPRLVMVRISGFGQNGLFAERPCFDVIAQAMSGLMEITGEDGGKPVPSGAFIIDQVTGLYATVGALGALQARERTGRGQVVDTALLDSAVTLLLTAIPEYALFGVEATRKGARDRYSAPANNYLCRDGRWVHVNAGNDALFPRWCKAAGLADLITDERFSSHAARMANADAIEAIVADWAAQHDADAIVDMMVRAEVPSGKVATIAEVVANPQLKHREQIVDIDYPGIGKVPMHGVTVKLSGTANSIRRPAPSIGQHTSEVLTDWLG
ncbi:CaiB/BaiF CoA transferase family protein [Chelatococcus sp. GCM10030263]|uniref:CaiB/BaiF CoA transferase family protein n=1 Tax=Chelatococcus sp. GCM10030263 TaxID=3273387 RepID=UPI0036073EE2